MLGSAVAAFAHRGARTRSAWSFLIYAALLALAIVLLAAWIAPDARASDEALVRSWRESGSELFYRLRPELWSTLALADVIACFVLGVMAFLIAPAMVAAAVANERRNGTLDQLRTTPLSPLALACGLIVGAPARLWLLAAGPLAVHVVAAVAGPLPLVTLAQSIAVLAVGAAAGCALGLCVALAPRQESGGAFAALGVAAVMLALSSLAMTFAGDRQMIRWAFVHPAGALDAVMLSYDGLWRRMLLGPLSSRFDDGSYTLQVALAPLTSIVAGLTLGAILVRAACRKLGQPDRPLLGKPLALGLFALAAATVTAPLATLPDARYGFDGAGALALTLLIAPALVLCGLYATPTAEAWSMGLRRGCARWTHDAAPPHRLVWLLELGWTALVIPLVGHHLWHSLDGNELWALTLAALGALSLPAYLLFANTRFATAGARWAFTVAVTVHGVAQLVAIGMLWGHDVPVEGLMRSYLLLATLAGVAVPAWVAWRQQVLSRQARA